MCVCKVLDTLEPWKGKLIVITKTITIVFLNPSRSNLRKKGSVRLRQHHRRQMRQRRDPEQVQESRSSNGELRRERPSGRRLRLRDHVVVPGRDRQTSAQRRRRTSHSGRRALHRLHQELGLVPQIWKSVSQKQHAQRHLYLQGNNI